MPIDDSLRLASNKDIRNIAYVLIDTEPDRMTEEELAEEMLERGMIEEGDVYDGEDFHGVEFYHHLLPKLDQPV